MYLRKVCNDERLFLSEKSQSYCVDCCMGYIIIIRILNFERNLSKTCQSCHNYMVNVRFPAQWTMVLWRRCEKNVKQTHITIKGREICGYFISVNVIGFYGICDGKTLIIDLTCYSSHVGALKGIREVDYEHHL